MKKHDQNLRVVVDYISTTSGSRPLVIYAVFTLFASDMLDMLPDKYIILLIFLVELFIIKCLLMS